MVLKRKNYGYSDMFLLAFRTSPIYTFISLFVESLRALIPSVTIFATAHFIDTSILVYKQDVYWTAILPSIFILAGTRIFSLVYSVFWEIFYRKRIIHFRKVLMPEIIRKRSSLSYRYMENSDATDLIHRTCNWIDGSLIRRLDQLRNIIYVTVMIVGVTASLFTQVWWIALGVFLSNIPLLLIASKAGKKNYEAQQEMTKAERRANYFSSVLHSREALEERTIYGYGDEINQRYMTHYEHARKFKFSLHNKMNLRIQLGRLFTTLYSMIIIMVMMSMVVTRQFTIGMFISIVQAIFSLSRQLSGGIPWSIEEITRNREWLKDLTTLVHMDEDDEPTAEPDKNMDFKILEFRNVSFRYPGTKKLVLDNCSFTIMKDKHYAFVGENGAGKTTIAKLITGLYREYEGDILIDGRSLLKLQAAQLKGLCTVVFQDFARYNISLYDNVAISNPTKDHISIIEALENAGVSQIDFGLNNIHTPLGKIMQGGVDISEGQWQRVALARSVLSDAPLIILDEPTSSLDPIREIEVYQNFKSISKGKTPLFISHRLGSTKLADEIFVLSEGKIVENGSHTDLINRNGLYSEMFKAQAEWYGENIS